MKTAIFLGAGASKADGAPLQGEIFNEYFTSSAFKQSYNDMDRELATFFLFMFGIDVDHGIDEKTMFPTFEEALGILDLAATRDESFKNFDGLNAAINSNRIGHLRNHFILLMAKALKDKLSNTSKYHTMLINNLSTSGLIDDISFISTNYDILIDNALESECSDRQIDYGVNLAVYGFEEHQSPIKLYKLHGSLNWLYCPACNKLTLTPHRKCVTDLIDDIGQALCKSCQELQTPIIVPPTYYKNMSNVFLSAIWYKAEQLLREVEHIIFCGYSFPDADMHIKYLLKRIEINRSNNKPLYITVINGFKGKSNKQKIYEKERYYRYFNGQVKYTSNSFEDFANSPTEFLR